MADVTVEGPYTDTGTGAVEGPPPEVTVTMDHDNLESTGAVDGPPAEVTMTSLSGDEATESTNAVPGPPAEVTSYEWPAQAPAEKTSKKAISGDDPDVENKAVRSASTKKG